MSGLSSVPNIELAIRKTGDVSRCTQAGFGIVDHGVDHHAGRDILICSCIDEF